MWWIISLIILYFLIGMYITASSAIRLQQSVASDIRLGKSYKIILVILGLFWIVIFPKILYKIIKVRIIDRKKYKFFLSGGVVCAKCHKKIPQKYIDSLYGSIEKCKNCEEQE